VFLEYGLTAPTQNIGRCEPYTGKLCYDGDRSYFIPAGKTQTQIDNSIITFFESEQYKYQACPEFMKNALCAFMYSRCENDTITDIKQTFILPPCKENCVKVRESLCVKGLDHKGVVKKWIDNNLNCDKHHKDDYTSKKCYDADIIGKSYSMFIVHF